LLQFQQKNQPKLQKELETDFYLDVGKQTLIQADAA
jgi:hypothetical protein